MMSPSARRKSLTS